MKGNLIKSLIQPKLPTWLTRSKFSSTIQAVTKPKIIDEIKQNRNINSIKISKKPIARVDIEPNINEIAPNNSFKYNSPEELIRGKVAGLCVFPIKIGNFLNRNNYRNPELGINNINNRLIAIQQRIDIRRDPNATLDNSQM